MRILVVDTLSWNPWVPNPKSQFHSQSQILVPFSVHIPVPNPISIPIPKSRWNKRISARFPLDVIRMSTECPFVWDFELGFRTGNWNGIFDWYGTGNALPALEMDPIRTGPFYSV